MFANEWDLYKHLLSSHDWYYQFSDDHSVWSSGESVKNKIKQLKEKLAAENPTLAESLYNQYKKD